ncbi:MAG: thioredoxin family protein [Gemmataceae bacterium]|nr:thioredoxin family protein [Gemmataceae bacterium]
MRRVLFGMIAFVAGLALIASPAASQPPGGKEGKGKDGKGKGPGGAFKLGSALPPALVEELKLTDEQKAKLAEIEKNLKGELDKLLTDEQKKRVDGFRPAGPGAKGGKANPPAEKAPAPTEKGKPDDQTGLLPEAASIQWYATLDRGLAEAKRTGKPILFVSAAPHCAGVSGMW